MAITGNLKRELEKAQLALMRHPETGFYTGVIMLGKSEIIDDPQIPTACTDGRNKFYNRKFMQGLKDAAELRALILHENKHVANKHIHRHRDLMKEDAQLANAAMDYVVNDEIMSLDDKTFCTLPASRLYDPMFHGWSVREIYNYLKKGQKPNCPKSGKKPQRGPSSVKVDGKEFQLGPMDTHELKDIGDLTADQINELERQIDEAVRQGAMLAGLRSANIPRGIREAITPEVDWRAETADFMSSMARGADEYTWRRYNPRRLADDHYQPTTYSEKLTELIIACDMSGSIGGPILQTLLGAIVAAAESTQPDIVRVLWWDTVICGEQTFEGNYGDLLTMLKPRGGGGTRVGCVSEYVKEKGYQPDCLIVLTDGYVESNPQWDISVPTLWLVTECETFCPPKGQKVKVNIHD